MGISRTAGVVSGPLAAFEAGFRAELRRTGYTPRSERSAVAAMAQLSGWMQRLDLEPEALSPAVLAARPRRLRGIRPVVRFLRRQGVVPAASCVDGAGPVEAFQAEFYGLADPRAGPGRRDGALLCGPVACVSDRAG